MTNASDPRHHATTIPMGTRAARTTNAVPASLTWKALLNQDATGTSPATADPGAWFPSPILSMPAVTGATEVTWDERLEVATLTLWGGFTLELHRDLVDRLLAPLLVRAMSSR